MQCEVTPGDIRRYQTDGFLVMPQFLDDDEVDRWRTVVDDAVAMRRERIPGTVLPGVDTPAADAEQERRAAYFRGIYTQKVNLWQTSAQVRELILDDGVCAVAGALAGVDALRVWHDQALYKEPFGNPTPFHLDVPYFSFTSNDAITIWIALDDATPENGCLYYVPGSHKVGRYDNVPPGPEIGSVFDLYPEMRDVPPAPCPVSAGGALFHNGLTIHGAGANMTPRRRRAMTCAFMPDGCTFNGRANVLPPALLQRLEVGDLLDDEAQNPLVFRRPEAGPSSSKRQSSAAVIGHTT